MEARHESDTMEVGSESADGEGDGQLQRTANRIIRILSQVAECLDEDEMEEMNAIVLEILELAKKNDTETKEMLIEYYIGFLELVEFCSGISVELIQQAIRSFLLIEQDAEGLGKLVYDLYMEMILVEYPSLGIDMNLTPDLLRAYFRLLTEGFEEICHIRLMVVGMYSVGKTTLIRRLCNQSIEDVDSTEAVDIFTNSCEINDDGDWEVSTNDEKDRFYSERLQELVNKYGKRTHIPNQDSSVLESEPRTTTDTTTDTTTSSLSTPTLPVYETEKVTFKMKVNENRQQNDKSFYGDFEKAAKEKKIPKRKPTVSIWDFAGQSVYYSTHHFFLNARSIYLVVLDLSKKLSDKVEERNPILESTTEDYTCHDAFKFWMKSIYIYTEQKKRKMAKSDHGRIQYPTYKPTIILIGTHKDKLKADDLKGKTIDDFADNYFFEALKCFIDTPVLDLVHRKKFLISKLDEAKEFLNIKREILEIAKGSPVWHEKVPANFILLEKAVYDRKNRGDELMDFEDLEKVNKNSDLPSQNKDDIKAFLVFHHAFGNVMYYGQDFLDQMIILNPQWIINIFKIFITHKHETNKLMKQQQIIKQFGKFDKDFILHLLEEKGWSNRATDIVRCMESLNVMVRPIAPVENDAPETRSVSPGRMTAPFFEKYRMDKQTEEDFYIMPSQLPLRPTDEELQTLFENCESWQPPTLCLYIKKDFLPPFVFHCIIATVLKVLPVAIVKGEYLMFSGLAGFTLKNTRILLIWCIDNCLHFTVIFNDDDETPEDRMECCKDVKRDFEDLVLRAFNFHGKNTFDKDDLFEYWVKCPKCPRQVPFQKAKQHNRYIKMEGLLKVQNLEITHKMLCNICSKVVKEKEAVEYWFDFEKNEKESACLVQEEHLLERLTLDMLADFAEEITSNQKQLAKELSVDYERIKCDHGTPNTNLVFHILYNWNLCRGSPAVLLKAMKNSKCSTDNFDRIVKRVETENTNQKITEYMEKLDVIKSEFEQDIKWGKVVSKLVDCIGNEFWILGIRLGIHEKDMQKMSHDHEGNSKHHIMEYLEAWRKQNAKNRLHDLVKALVKSSSDIDGITKGILEIYSG